MLTDIKTKNDRARFWSKKINDKVLTDKLEDLGNSIKTIMDFMNMELWLAKNNSFTKIKDPSILALASISGTEAELIKNIENLKIPEFNSGG
tara:strand:+ start:192 stop:467 length:276 start_codon:yes stop_codon:yes gene_type:complete